MRLDLPDEKTFLREVRTIAFELDRGVVPSAVHYRARERFVGRGERMGVRTFGRIRDLNITATIIKGEPVFRDDRVAPQRRVLMLVDLSTLDDSHATRRLLTVAAVTAGVLASLSDVRVILSAFGCRDLALPFPMWSSRDLPIAIRTLEAYARRTPEKVNAGKLRFAALDADRSHVVIVTHYLDPDLVGNVAFPLGCTTVLVRPPAGVLSRGELGLAGGWSAFGPTAALDHRIDKRYARYLNRMRTRGRTFVVPGKGTPLQAVREAVASAERGRAI